jgi:hypothetical protein
MKKYVNTYNLYLYIKNKLKIFRFIFLNKNYKIKY